MPTLSLVDLCPSKVKLSRHILRPAIARSLLNPAVHPCSVLLFLLVYFLLLGKGTQICATKTHVWYCHLTLRLLCVFTSTHFPLRLLTTPPRVQNKVTAAGWSTGRQFC